MVGCEAAEQIAFTVRKQRKRNEGPQLTFLHSIQDPIRWKGAATVGVRLPASVNSTQKSVHRLAQGVPQISLHPLKLIIMINHSTFQILKSQEIESSKEPQVCKLIVNMKLVLMRLVIGYQASRRSAFQCNETAFFGRRHSAAFNQPSAKRKYRNHEMKTMGRR